MKPVFFAPPLLEGLLPHTLLSFRYSSDVPWQGVFDENLPPNFFATEAQFVERLEDAQAVILPHNFTKASPEVERYIAQWCDAAEKAEKPVYLFAFGDLNDDMKFDPRTHVFRLSTYKSIKRAQDIVVPTTVQIFSDIVLRKKEEVPVVSFCGYASLNSVRLWLSYHLKNILWNLKGNPARKLGIYWRRTAMRALRSSPLVRTNFIIRRSFSGALRTIELSPEVARKEFIASIVESDFVLAPKGDGNYSNRFLEALSLGRIPVLIDTETVLPLEERIDYEKIVVRVPMKDVRTIARYVRNFYDKLTEEEWKGRQQMAHEVFTQHLRQDAFFREFFLTSR